MTAYLRVERQFRSAEWDSPGERVAKAISVFFPQWKNRTIECRTAEVFWAAAEGEAKTLLLAMREVLKTPLQETAESLLTPWQATPSQETGAVWCLEKSYRFGVTDNTGNVLAEALAMVAGTTLKNIQGRTGQRLWLRFADPVDAEAVRDYAASVFYNDLIETCSVRTAAELLADAGAFSAETLSARFKAPQESSSSCAELERFDVAELSGAEFLKLSSQKLWAFAPQECAAVAAHYRKLGRPATDVELEVIAQTWSEHCKHKIFAAEIEVLNERGDLKLPAHVDGLFNTYIRGATQKTERPYLRSVFHDNAGVIEIDEKHDVAIKVETHNSPSALDPYGGALTGVVGVNRDILGVGLGAEPIANLDVFCVGPLDYAEKLPERLHHPRRVLEGVRSGIQDGGNKSGVPTITGAIVHHPKFLGKPLIYCGTLGLLPKDQGDLLKKEILPGAAIVMVGGRIGKDGIHGATFSSLEMNEDSPVSAVQLGDPLTQRRVWDFLLEARDKKLFTAVTDNGAGGLSSSVGELARLCGTRGGAALDVSSAKTKYPGLKAFELVVSESQERMTCAVPPHLLPKFLDLAARRGTECSVLGEFQDSGAFKILFKGETVAELDMEFLHEGVPRMQLKARVVKPQVPAKLVRVGAWQDVLENPASLQEALPRVLSSENVRSRRGTVEQYDHEVGARTVRKPYGTQGRGAPNDGGVLRLSHESKVGVAVGLGLSPQIALIDAAKAAAVSMDEAFRNALASGMDPDHAALVDNFCWPDPLPGEHNPDAKEKLGALVATSKVLFDGAVALHAPFVSGKDSMKNDYRMGSVKVSVPPTVLITVLGKVRDVTRIPMGGAAGPGRSILWISGQDVVPDALGLPKVDFDRLREFAKIFHELCLEGALESVHDVSDGGWLATTVEMLFDTGLGADLRLSAQAATALGQAPLSKAEPDWAVWFTEPATSFVACVAQERVAAIRKRLKDFFVCEAGATSVDAWVRVQADGFEKAAWKLSDLERAYGI